MNRLQALLALALLGLTAPLAAAEQFGLFTYEVNDDDTVAITSCSRDAVGHIDIPAEIEGRPVVTIGGRAFWRRKGVTSVTIPAGVTSLQGANGSGHAIPPSGAFEGCTALASIALPPSLASIGHRVFSGCSKLETLSIPDSVTSIGPGAFADCTAVTHIGIPEGVTSIRHGTFSGCTSLTSVSIPNSVTSFGGGAFSGCTGLTSITIPDGVTEIGWSTFSSCTSLTSITIPASVTEIGHDAFSGCTGLASIWVDPLNLNYSSLDGVLFDKDKALLIQYSTGRSGEYALPEGVTSIGDQAFSGCTGLTSVTIPGDITSIGDGAFSDCAGLTAVSFLGDSPSFIGNAFDRTTPEFSIYYLSTSTGFTSPTWNAYPAVEIDVDTYPAAPWLLEHGLPHDTDLHQDLNNDGVSLLMAYALDLDPRQNLRSRLPLPALDADTLGLTFHAASPGITYTAQTSTDLQTWTSEGVATSELNPEGLRTATIPRDTPQRFLRLVVE